MELSIIIINWNTKKLLLDCLKSVFKSKPLVSYEVIVVDNGSTDGSLAAVRALQKNESKKLKLITNKENLGYSKANNIGIRKAKGKYLLLLNSDTRVKEGAIDSLYNFAKSRPDAGVIGSKLLNADGTLQPSVFKFPTIIRAIREYWFGEKGLFGKYAPETDEPIKVDVVVGASFLITPRARKEVGLLNEKYFFFWEDLDYCRQARAAGLTVYYLPASEVFHYHGSTVRKVTTGPDAWKKLIPGSKLYHGLLRHYLITIIIWLSQKLKGFLVPLLLIFLIIPTFWQLARPGYFPMQDDLQAFRVQQMDKCFDDFQIPCRWVPDAGYQYGYPQFNYYPPFPYYLGALLHRVGFQYIDSVKILFIFGYISSALAMYLLVKSLTNRWAGLVAALLYTYIPYKAVEVFVRGALNEFWAQIFFPLIFWASYKLIKTGKRRYLVFLGLFLAMLATTHLLMAMIFAPVISIWVLFWLYKGRGKNLGKLMAAGILAFSLSAFFVLPVAFERQFAHVESLLSGYFDYRQHFVSLKKLFLSMEWGYGSSGFPDEKLNLSLGVVHWLFGLVIAPVLALMTYKKEKRLSVLVLIFWLVGLFSIFMIHLRSSFIWSQLPILAWLQFPWRLLAICIFLLIFVAGISVQLLGKLKYHLGILLVVSAFGLYSTFFIPKEWLLITDQDKFSSLNWEKQLTISIFDYLPIYATLPPWQKAPELPEVLEGETKFSDYQKRSNYQTGKALTQEDSLIRLPLFDFPGMEVHVDGLRVAHRNDDCRGERYCLGLITFKLSKGEHTFVARLYDTPIRRLGNLITLSGLGILGILVVKSAKKIR